KLGLRRHAGNDLLLPLVDGNVSNWLRLVATGTGADVDCPAGFPLAGVGLIRRPELTDRRRSLVDRLLLRPGQIGKRLAACGHNRSEESQQRVPSRVEFHSDLRVRMLAAQREPQSPEWRRFSREV